jgi:hypothetical protein
MKSLKTKSLITIFLFVLFSSCEKKDEIELTGTVKLVFANYDNINDLNVFKPQIYGYTTDIAFIPPLIPDIVIASDGNSELFTLNYGNYICEYSVKVSGTSDSFEGRQKAFQIIGGEHLDLVIDLKSVVSGKNN